MLGIVKEIDGQKKIVPLTSDTGTGAPVGTLISQYKKKPISGYLYCDGSTFDENAYPALYMYLGSNVLPDYRECVMVGAEQNTTDIIATHDVYGEGEFKDDRLQDHMHFESANAGGPDQVWGNVASGSGQNSGWYTGTVRTGYGYRFGTTTHGKQKAVYVYIKATSGLAENQQDNVLNEVKDYIRRSNELSPIETITLTTTYQTAQYDGFLFVYMIGDAQTEILVNESTVYVSQVPSGHANTAVIPLSKGDKFGTTVTTSIIWCRARWYKNR